MATLPRALQSATSFYAFLGVGPGERKFLEKHAAYRYERVFIRKRRGGKRILLVPERRLKFLQRRTLLLLQRIESPRVPVHGFIKGRSAITNAGAHQARQYVLNVDLRNYFGEISLRRVLGMFKAIGLNEEVAEAICWICVTRDQLPQGGPTSPILSNMVAYRLDRLLMDFAKAHRLRYTRYADDISLSGYSQPTLLFEGPLPASGRVAIDHLSAPFRSMILSNGFAINPEKIWFSGPKSRKEVTGLIVNEFTNVKRKFVRNLRAALYKIETMGVTDAEKDYHKRYKGSASLEQVLRGRLEWMAQIRGRSFSAYRTLAKRFNQQFPISPLRILPTYEEIAERAVWIVEFFAGDVCEQGTAFFLEGVGLVTADHVLEKLPHSTYAELYRPSEPSKKFKGKPTTRRCAHRDLSILDHDIPINNYLALPVATSPDRTNDKIIALGFAAYGPGDQLGKRRGHIIGSTTKHGVKLIEVSAVLSGGISGGPIVNDRYQVIAIAHRGGNQQHKQLAVEVSELLRLAEE
jgi:RNA-directed DNA polymerase